MRTLMAAVLAAFFVFPALAQQQRNCAPRPDALAAFFEQYGETTIIAGLSQKGHVMELLVNYETRTWTILGTTLQGLACQLDAGEAWQLVEPKPPGVSQ